MTAWSALNMLRASLSAPLFCRHHATLYASKDPVALDVCCLDKLEEGRIRGSLPAIGHMAEYVCKRRRNLVWATRAAPERIHIQARRPNHGRIEPMGSGANGSAHPPETSILRSVSVRFDLSFVC